MSIDRTVPAFPVPSPGGDGYYSGASVRQWFAVLAMQGLLASDRSAKPEEFAKTAVAMADALVAELGGCGDA